MCPSSFTSRYLIASIHSAYFVAVPRIAANHIQKRAPGPPAAMAVATPTMLPVPIVAERAVHNAEKPESSPAPSFFLKIPLKARPSFENWIPREAIVRIRPVARIRMIVGRPHTMSSI